MGERYALTQKPLSLRIDKLGPIRDSELRLGDITLLLGRPNTGKSYVLRAVYSSLAPLDPYFLSQIREFLTAVLAERVVRTNEIHSLDVCVEESIKGKSRRPCTASFNLKPNLPRLVAESLRLYGRVVAGKYHINRPRLDKIIQGILEEGLKGEKTVELYYFPGTGSPSHMHVQYELDRELLKVNVEVEPPALEVEEPEELLMLLLSISSRNYSHAIAKAVVEELMEHVPSAVRSQYTFTTVVFLTYGRGLLSRLLERPSKLEKIESLLAKALGVEVASTIHRIREGYEKWLDIQEGRGEEWSIRLVKSVEPLLEGKLLSGPQKKPRYLDWSGAETPLTLSSALVGEYAALLYAALASRDGLLLIEEPESQLHPSAQVAMAVLLAALPALCGCRVAASTHSDLLALTLSYIAHYKPSPRDIESLIYSAVPHAAKYREGVEVLAEAASQASRDILTYYFERDGGYTKIRLVDPEDVMSGVPGIKETLGALAKWVGRLEWGED